jgi:hypothetical protein
MGESETTRFIRAWLNGVKISLMIGLAQNQQK